MKIIKKTAEIFRFCIVGGMTFLIDYALLYVATEYIEIRYLYSAGISFTVAALLNYWLCLVYVFRPYKKQRKKQIVMFFFVSIIGLGLNQLCMWIFVEWLMCYYLVAKVFATIIVTTWNYIMKRMTVQG